MASVWTQGTWTVKPGREEEFVRAWGAMRDSVLAGFGAIEPPTLLRDHERPNVFVSFGPWSDVDHISRFRGSEEFVQAFAALGELLDDFRTLTLDEVTP